MGFLAVAGCVLLATAMSAALTNKNLECLRLGGGELGGAPTDQASFKTKR